MAVTFMDLRRQNEPLMEELHQALDQLVESNQFLQGPTLSRFEEHFCEKTRIKHTIGVGSGSDALLLTLHALGIQPGDQVICPVFCHIATADVIPRIGATSVFVDVNENYTIDVDAVRQVINEGTRAVIVPHLFGRVAEIDELAQACMDYGIHLIEECSHACGAQLNERPVGTWGIAGAYSFHPANSLGALGDGGAIVTDNDELAIRLRMYRNHGLDDGRYREIAYDSHLDGLQAAFLDIKLSNIEEDNADRMANAAFYQSHLNGDMFQSPGEVIEGCHIYNYYNIRCSLRDQLKTFLKERQVETEILYDRPLHLEPCFEYLGYTEGQFPVAEQLSREVLSLPISPGLTRRELEEVAHAMDLFAQTYSASAAG